MTGVSEARWPFPSVVALSLVAALMIVSAACAGTRESASIGASEVSLQVGYGLGDVADPQIGIQQAVENVVAEGLVDFDPDGRPRLVLAEKWWSSADGLTWRVWIKPNALFHDGDPVSAVAVRDILLDYLPRYLGEPFDDISEIRAVSDRELLFLLKRPSSFLLEGLEAPVRKRGSSVIGTGPFHVTNNVAEVRANPQYYGGKPLIDRIIFRPYPSVRAAWAEMLRGQVDMLYETGVDALDSLERSTEINVFTFQRPYVYAVFLNTQRKPFESAAVRRSLNTAIDRKALISSALGGHGTAADGPVPPLHWARDPKWPRIAYAPKPIASGSSPIRTTCIVGEPSLERLALAVQQQLQAVGVELELESVGVNLFLSRLESGDFDCAVGAVISGPNLIRPYWAWHSGGPFNWGRFESRRVDLALDTIRHAEDDEQYKSAVAAFQHAVIEDAPAIFLAWSERARAVTTRFGIPVEPGHDILRTLRLWRPVTDRPN